MSDQRNETAEESALSDNVEEVRDSVAPIGEDSPADQTASEESAAADSAEPDDEGAAEEPTAADAEAAAEDTGPEEVDSTEEDSSPAEPSDAATAESEEADEDAKMDWYILKVQSNRENTIADALRRRVGVEGLEKYFGDIVVPSEMVTEFKGGKKKVVKRKLYPGYIVVHMAINDDTWFVVRETPGIGDFTGAGGKPTPMLPHEVQRIIQKPEETSEEAPKLKINFGIGDRVKINEGTFESFEGEVSTIDDQSGRITVMIQIFNRTTPVELEYWQVETL